MPEPELHLDKTAADVAAAETALHDAYDLQYQAMRDNRDFWATSWNQMRDSRDAERLRADQAEAQVAELEAWKTAHLALPAPAGHSTTPAPAVCPPGTDRAGQEIPTGETEAWCTIDDPDPDPPEEDLGKVIGGLWALHQTTAASNDLKSLMEICFTKAPSAVGFGLRYPLNQVIDSSGNLITASTGLLAKNAKNLMEINDARNKRYLMSLRPINGQHCPTAWKSAMPAQLLFTENGLQGVHPCYTAPITHAHDGLPTHSHAIGDPNDIYEIRWRKYLQQLVAWFTGTPELKELIRFVHGGYYSLEWSEYYNGPATQQSRGCPYSQAAHRNAHKRLATIMFEEMPEDVAVEWASTGHGPMVGTYTSGSEQPGSNPFIEEMLDHLVGLYGSGSDRVYFSMNGWSDSKIAGAPDAATEYSKQFAARNRASRDGDIRLELQDISAGWTGPWDTAFDFAHGGADDRLAAYNGAIPSRRTLGKNFNGQGDSYLRNGVFPIEIYAFRFQGTSGNAQYSAQLEANAASHRAHILAL